MKKIVLLRHGESEWNLENRFTGWTDVDLSEQGVEEAHKAGQLLKKEGFNFDLTYTSVLRRAIRTLWIVLREMDLMWIPIVNTWRLNERHYGALQGLNKAETAAKYGEEQVKIWRRSFDIPPPPLTKHDERYPGRNPRYSDLNPQKIPLTESLKHTLERVFPYWQKNIVPEIKNNHRILIAAHGNSLRALVKILDNVSDNEIVDLNIPTGIPLVYELDDPMKPITHYCLGDPSSIQSAMNSVANQGKAK